MTTMMDEWIATGIYWFFVTLAMGLIMLLAWGVGEILIKYILMPFLFRAMWGIRNWGSDETYEEHINRSVEEIQEKVAINLPLPCRVKIEFVFPDNMTDDECVAAIRAFTSGLNQCVKEQGGTALKVGSLKITEDREIVMEEAE